VDGLPVREIKSIQFKRIHLGNPFSGDDDVAGHWWFEIGDPATTDAESYGWYPKVPLRPIDVFIGVPGELNDGLNGARPARDPHHGEEADEKFYPLVLDQDERTDEDIEDCLREFAMTYSGKWQWLLGWGQNCHTFQRAAFRHCRLCVPSHVRKTKL
jgi:hypothetical protein